jgi:hypothetical protein
MNKEAGRKIIAERIEDFEKNKAILTKKATVKQISVLII